MEGSEISSTPQKFKQFLIVSLVGIILVSSLIIVDITSAGYEYQVAPPSLSHDLPETIYFYNISEGLTGNTFSFILVLPMNHSGHNRIIPREVNLIFWFNDSDSSTILSQFIMAVREGRPYNCTLGVNFYWTYPLNKSEGNWWTPSRTMFAFNDRPDIDSATFGVAFELILVNSFGDSFDGHESNVQLEMNVTYSRWWFGQRISESHQVVNHVFDLPDNGTALIQSLEYGAP